MRQDDPSRRPSWFQRLFAERQVYLRSGLESRYVVLSRSLQIGVTLGVLVIVGGLAFASYSSVAKHFEAIEQTREVERLEGMNKSLRAAAEASAENERIRAAAEQVPRLEAALAEAEAAQARAERLAEASAAETEAIRRELELAQERVRRVTESLAEAQAERDALAERLETAGGAASEGDGEDAAAALRAELETAATRIEELSQEKAALEERIAALTADAEAADGGDAAALGQQLAAARAEIERLNAALEEADAAGTGDQRVQSLEAELEAALTEVSELRLALQQAGVTPGAGPVAPLDLAPADAAGAAPPTPVATAGEATVSALSADLSAIQATVEALRSGDDGVSADRLAGLNEQVVAASERIDSLSRVLDQLKAREAAMQLAMSTLAPLPPPPAPR